MPKETLSKEELEYYSRQVILSGWGEATQLKIKNARVLVVGTGALGCAVLQNLARTGVGTIGIADYDVVSVSNLQRQVLFNQNDIGFSKVKVAKEKIQKINPFVKVEAINERIFEGNALELLVNYEIIVDGTDNFETKYLLNDACVILNKPLVAGSIESYEGQVAVFNYKDGPTYRCLFPAPPSKEQFQDCNTIGVTATLPLVIGNLQANEAVKIISGRGEVLSGKILIFNSLSNSFVALNIKANPENKNISVLEQKYDFGKKCEVTSDDNIAAVSLTDLGDEFWLLDVRSEVEHTDFNIGGENIPLYEIENSLHRIPAEKKVLTYCNGTLSAKQAALIISKKKNIRVYYLDSPLAVFNKA